MGNKMKRAKPTTLRVGRKFYKTAKDACKAAGIPPSLLNYRGKRYGETKQEALDYYYKNK